MNNSLQKALQAFNQQQYMHALQLLSSHTNKTADWYTLNSLCLSAVNRITDAEQCYLQGLRLHSKNVGLMDNYTNLLCKQKKYADCIQFCEYNTASLSLEKPRLNYIESLINQDELLKAEHFIKETSPSQSTLIRYHWLTLELYERFGDLKHIEDYFRTELPAQLKGQFHFVYKQACNYRNLGKFAEALALLQMLLKQQPSAELHYIVGCTYYDLQQYEQAQAHLKACLELAPNYVPAHESLNKLYWEHAQSELMSSYTQTFKHYDANPVLIHSQIGQLLQLDKLEEALLVSSEATQSYPQNLDLLHAHSIILDRKGDEETAFSLLQRLVKEAPHNARYSIDLANFYIQQGEYSSAISHLETAVKFNPNNQELWAYLSIAWRLSNNDKYHWLTNLDKFVKVMELPAPAGFKTFADFNHQLQELMISLHTNKLQPLDQSVRSGSQTQGHLLQRSNQLIDLFKTSMSQCINQYLTQLPEDVNHPLLARNHKRFVARGSWSVKLEEGGFHANHIHPQGWLSAPSYISIPAEMSKDDATKNGWLKLGETSLNLGERESIAREICPEEGQIIIFPSYIWHGTYQLKSNSPRLTIPCDIMPLK
ncbi:putative 2OG-Fe(II) oxygenase [Pseudoalteromonas gelatinilytica]